MPRPEYSEMLVNRRRQLGLSISQASQVLRLKEQVLIAFEEGDFDHIPKSGYAQGMLSSYARYLGLNPRIVVQQFSQDLNEYTAEARRGEYASMGSGPYVESRGLLPTSGGPAGDMGAFATTSQPHSRQQSSPLVNQRRYVGSLHDGASRSYGYSEEDAAYLGADTGETEAYVPATRTVARSAGSTRASSARRRSSGTRARSAGSGSSGRTRSRDYDDRSASSRRSSGRSRSQSSSGRNQRRAPRRSGGLLASLLGDTRMLITMALAILAVVVTVGVIFAARSCSTRDVEGDTAKTVPVSESTGAEEESGSASAAPEADKDTAAETGQQEAASDAPAGTASSTGASTATGTNATNRQTTTAKKTEVQVSVEAGQVSWVEILCDGNSEIASTVTGPWSQTYDVKDSITVEVGDTAAVTVTENGKQRQFDTKTSGIGSITIEGTPDPETLATEDGVAPKEGDAATTTEVGNAQEVNVDAADAADKAAESTSQGTGDDEYLYTINGYDIYHSADGYDYFIDPDSGARLNPTDGSPIG